MHWWSDGIYTSPELPQCIPNMTKDGNTSKVLLLLYSFVAQEDLVPFCTFYIQIHWWISKTHLCLSNYILFRSNVLNILLKCYQLPWNIPHSHLLKCDVNLSTVAQEHITLVFPAYVRWALFIPRIFFMISNCFSQGLTHDDKIVSFLKLPVAADLSFSRKNFHYNDEQKWTQNWFFKDCYWHLKTPKTLLMSTVDLTP